MGIYMDPALTRAENERRHLVRAETYSTAMDIVNFQPGWRENGAIDCQVTLIRSIVCGVLFCPFATARLYGHFTDKCDPDNIPVSLSCGHRENRGYNEIGYTDSPRIGNGLSKRGIDIQTVIGSGIGIAAGIFIGISSANGVIASTSPPATSFMGTLPSMV